ncbi:hypothetical protein N7481_011676 [Penicillium waksmanii]|uniref:uncharacterized protein n=1 Tax=Penicillium waksmanii TaxID=69791 RepID=UPI002546BB47|nr:uncharacterized protein N7481_011676 [Penicillium waksmanii]KAJ5974466.1 hypothetical protein N7481_011676 [Penicillium waksmanii]
MTTGVSPLSSPRLPSPPPFTEVQIGPQSPSVGETFGKDADQILGVPAQDDASTRRIRPGSKAVNMAFGPPLIPLSQHLKALYHHFTKPEGSDTVVPINRQVAIELAEPPEGVDRSLWLYELCRFLTMKVNNLLIAFFAEDPPCSAQTCPEMRASEWQYLCAVHEPPKSCCAIDYCCHTLDWATNTLTSPKNFPSRLTLGSETAGGPQASMRHLTNIFRRLYRIFAHAWFQHRNVFWEVEGNDGLYVFFKTVCDMYNLIPEDNYTIPAEAEGLDATEPQGVAEPVESKRLTILRKDGESPFGSLENMAPPTRYRRHHTTTQAHLRDSPEPRPQSPVKAEIEAEIAAEETAETPIEATESVPADGVEVQEPTESPVETEQTAEQPIEDGSEKDAEQSHIQESEETETPESTEKAPEGDDVTTPSVNREAKEETETKTDTEAKSEAESEATAEAESKTES